ncbi:hypothetical protein F5051DRAFT_405382 [Lentinula edodes]|nr:hypothetical protein F5051DRAFT_405382 [Lentinula edodes]
MMWISWLEILLPNFSCFVYAHYRERGLDSDQPQFRHSSRQLPLASTNDLSLTQHKSGQLILTQQSGQLTAQAAGQARMIISRRSSVSLFSGAALASRKENANKKTLRRRIGCMMVVVKV